jgi:hypothetical protein
MPVRRGRLIQLQVEVQFQQLFRREGVKPYNLIVFLAAINFHVKAMHFVEHYGVLFFFHGKETFTLPCGQRLIVFGE